MEMTPNLVPNANWVPCASGLPEQGKFVWVLVGKIVQVGMARRYHKEVHMATFEGEGHFKIYPYRLPIISNQIWAWAQMVPPSVPITKMRPASDTEEWKDVASNGEEWKDADNDYDDDEEGA